MTGSFHRRSPKNPPADVFTARPGLQLARLVLVLALGASAAIVLAEARHVLRPFLGAEGSRSDGKVCPRLVWTS